MSNYSYLLKYIIIGDASVGKSCVLMQFLSHTFKVDSQTTVGVEFGSRIVQSNGEQIKLQIWDTAGQEIFKSITRSYYRGSIGALLMYDITNRQSFLNVSKWIDETRSYANEKLTIILVGNKNDLSHKRQVTEEEGKAFAKAHRMLFKQCSAKNREQTQAVFIILAQTIIEKIKNKQIDPTNQTFGVKVGDFLLKNETNQNSNKCC